MFSRNLIKELTVLTMLWGMPLIKELRSQQAIQKSGGFTNALKQGAIIGETIFSNLNRAGLADVPGIGIASKLAETGTWIKERCCEIGFQER
jgi:hypothetical protein